MTMRFRMMTAVLATVLISGCGEAQMGADPETFKAVDALYTAVSLREPARVDQCLATLKSLKEAGKVDPSALEVLDGICAEGKSGSWESAQSQLARFMRGQTRGR